MPVALKCGDCEKGWLVPAELSGNYAPHYRCTHCKVVVFVSGEERIYCIDVEQHLAKVAHA